MKVHDIEERAFAFACRVIEMEICIATTREVKPNALNQVTSSATAIGANLEEARGAQTRADFHAKIHISLKEARESKYWLRIIAKASRMPPKRFEALIQEAGEIIAILTTIAKKTNPDR